MKKILVLLVAATCGLLQLTAQNSIHTKQGFYYYKGEKISIPFNTKNFVVYSTSVGRDSFIKSISDYKMVKEIHCSFSQSIGQRYAYQLFIENNNYDSICNVLKQNAFIDDVEPVIGDSLTVTVSNIFYVKLKRTGDYGTMASIAKNNGVTVLREVPNSNGWYALEANKNSTGNSIESSNLFWETKLFEDVDPGFIFEFQTNSCLSDSDFNLQWGMNSINACNAWAITTGTTNVNVAVIDQGIDVNHREFSHTNVSYSFDAVNYTPQANVYGNHGTHVGGVIFSSHDENRIAGVAPNTSMINISHHMYITNTISEEFAVAFYNAIINGAYVINNSWGDQGGAYYNDLHSAMLENAIDNALDNGRNGKGCVVVFASGNYNVVMDYPATYRPEIFTVGAIDSSRRKAYYSGYGTSLDIVAPGSSVYSTIPNGGYCYMDGTSMAAPHVSGVAALVLSVNPDLTGQQVRDILESTAQKVGGYNYQPNQNHPNGTWNDSVGYGLVDAYAAVKRALGYPNDLYVRDTVTDDGTMPSSCYSTWDSPDIWVETLDGQYVAYPHGNTKYAVCVKIHNRRDVASSGTERLFLNWAKAGFNDSWDEYWTGNNPLPCGAPKGGVIGSANGKIIPSIPANSYRIDTIHWITPAGEDYEYCTDFNYNQWHFCLLARIHDDDVIAHENEHDADVHQLVKNHNNVAQQNVYLDSAENYRKTLGIGNVHTIDMSRIICLSPKVIGNVGSITDFAEVYITLDAGLLAAINSANISGLTWVNSNTLRWNGGSASIPVTLPANSYYTLQTTVHFIADQIPANNNFDFDIVLRNAAGDTVLGGEHYRCVRTNGRYFQAVAHDNMTILWGETASLYATDILETAEYKWYDEQGDEVGDGLTCNVTPLQNTTYTLRVTADADGYRAYSTVDVIVVDGELRLLAPNPADNQVRIGYALSRNVSAATLQILNGSGQVVYTQALSGGNGSKVTGEDIVNTSYLAAGSYTVRLVSSNGKVHDSKTLVVR